MGLLKEVWNVWLDSIRQKRELRQAIHENKVRLALSEQEINKSWEMRQLENIGWKDDILFYFFIGVFVWAGLYPEQASTFFQNIQFLPDWFVKLWFWVIASVLGIKKIGDYAPQFINGMKDLFTKR